MLFTAIDTETTGKHDFKLPYNHPGQPFPLQIGLVSVDADRKPVHRLCLLLNPGGLWDAIDKEAFDIHGITLESCYCFGVNPARAVFIINQIILKSETVIAHGIEHDVRVLSNLADALFMKLLIPPEKQFCTMKEFSKAGIKLPGQKWPKWPSLEELHTHYFGKGFSGAHNALSDAEAAMRCFWEMKANKDMKGID
jgi:DNA polymerase-3 subunit epsilon